MRGSASLADPDAKETIGRAVPISRLNLDEYNLLTVHS
ncbi:hypothetical protein L571_2023 [Bordetella pertussis 2371640]|nr:hypothetical protein L571_2023 [Bordetella pertussis 2371640]